MKFYYPDHVLNDEVFNIILSTCHEATLESLNDPDRFRQRARTIGSNIFDMTPIHSGLISVGCITAILEKRQDYPTKEHFNGRQQCGEQILKYVKKQKKKKQPLDDMYIKELVDKYRHVHFTSKEENIELAALAKKYPSLQTNWKQMYKLKGIKLIEYVKYQRYDRYVFT